MLSADDPSITDPMRSEHNVAISLRKIRITCLITRRLTLGSDRHCFVIAIWLPRATIFASGFDSFFFLYGTILPVGYNDYYHNVIINLELTTTGGDMDLAMSGRFGGGAIGTDGALVVSAFKQRSTAFLALS